MAVLVLVGALVGVPAFVAWLGIRIRRRGIGGDLMGPLDLIYNPGAHRFRPEIRTYEERTVPLPAAEDGLRRTPCEDRLPRTAGE